MAAAPVAFVPEASRLRLTTNAESTATWIDIVGEWGLSILVEAGERRFLLDTGASATTVANAVALCVDLAGVEAIVLSHGHADHTGGLLPVLSRINGSVRVVAHPAIWEPKYSRDLKTSATNTPACRTPATASKPPERVSSSPPRPPG